jgi:putative hydrolase of the HAD superfamily
MLIDVQTVIFDLDGTLLNRRSSFTQFVRGQWERFNHVLQPVDREQYAQALIENDRDGYAPRRELFPRTLARFQLPLDLADALLQDYRASFPGACVLFPDAESTLTSLRAAGFRLGLITNGSARMQTGKLTSLGLAPTLDTVLISDAEGVSKPHPEIFRRALERLDTAAQHAVFVGDHPEVDVSGARRAGLKSVWRRDRAGAPPVDADATIDKLSDLLDLLGVAQ